LHNEEFRDWYSSPSIIRIKEDEMDGACSTNGGEEDLVEVGWVDVDWIGLIGTGGEIL
jgi:hypothetical protein